MLGCYTALEGRWSRGRQVEFLSPNILVAKSKHSMSEHFPINLLFQGVRWKQFLLAGLGMEVEDTGKHKRK